MNKILPVLILTVFVSYSSCTTHKAIISDYNSLVQIDFNNRRKQNKLITDYIITEQDQKILLDKICPFHKIELMKVDLPASMKYGDTGNMGYFCSTGNEYWVRHTQGAFIGSISEWWGPFKIGE